MLELSQTYQSAIEILKKTPPIGRENKINPRDYIVATHGPALTKAVMERPEILDLIGIYRFNCSHLGKESDLSTLAEYLKVIHQHSPILIDLQ